MQTLCKHLSFGQNLEGKPDIRHWLQGVYARRGRKHTFSDSRDCPSASDATSPESIT